MSKQDRMEFIAHVQETAQAQLMLLLVRLERAGIDLKPGWRTEIERLEAGDETIEQMLPRLYVGIDKRLWPAAALSVLAHLIKLCREGRVAADPLPSLEARFRLT